MPSGLAIRACEEILMDFAEIKAKAEPEEQKLEAKAKQKAEEQIKKDAPE
jgi:hypothetical protein